MTARRPGHTCVLERDVVPGGLDELADQHAELWVVGVELVQLSENPLALLLLADGLVGELVAIRQGQPCLVSTRTTARSGQRLFSADGAEETCQ